MFYLDEMRGVPEKSDTVSRTKEFDLPLQKDRKGRYMVPSGLMLSINMTSDTFIEDADPWRDEMWSIIRKRPDVIFYILTKRVGRIRGCLPEDWGDGYENVILSITCETQRAFDERWPVFERIPAKHKQLNLAPMISPVDVFPAVASGQIEQVNLSGEGFGGRRPCRYEWIEAVSRACEENRVNLIVNYVGSVFYKDGTRYELETLQEQGRWAYRSGLGRFFGRPRYNLYSPYDRHLLTDDEIGRPVYNSHMCRECVNRPVCYGCLDCGGCKQVSLVDADWNPVETAPSVRTLDDFLE